MPSRIAAGWRTSVRLYVIAVTTFLSTASFADDLSTVSDPASVGLSAARLARIDAWYESQIPSTSEPIREKPWDPGLLKRVPAQEKLRELGSAASTSAPVRDKLREWGTNSVSQPPRDPNSPSGAVIAIAKNGKLAYLKAFGSQNDARTVPMKADSIFWIAGLTEPVTSVAAMMLVDDGKLELDAPASRYLPQLADMQVGVVEKGSTGEAVITRQPAKRAMTVRDLLRHTSGLVYHYSILYPDDPIYGSYKKVALAPETTLAEFVANLSGLPLAHQPGEVFDYGGSVDVLARIVEIASGQPFDEFLKSRIFQPLRMIDTGFYVPTEKFGRFVDLLERVPQYDVTRPRKLLSGSEGLVSTASDYLRFCQMLLNGGELDGVRLLKPGTVQLMTRDSLSPGVSEIRAFTGPIFGTSFGLGVDVRTGDEFSIVPGAVGSYSRISRWGTYFWVDPVERLIAVQMIQVKPERRSLYYSMLRNLTYGALQVAQRERSAKPTASLALTRDALNAYGGKYNFGSSSSARDNANPTMSRFGGIGAQLLPQPTALRVYALTAKQPAVVAGLRVGDLITAVDDVPIKDFKDAYQVWQTVRGAPGSPVRLRIQRDGQSDPIEITPTRILIYNPGVELEVKASSGKLLIEATGAFSVLDFEKGKTVAMRAISDGEFEVIGGDRTRIAFVKDDSGKVVAAILNPGPWQQRGVRFESPAPDTPANAAGGVSNLLPWQQKGTGVKSPSPVKAPN